MLIEGATFLCVRIHCFLTMSSQPPVLYSHAIECVLSFLSLRELGVAMRVSSLWLQASCRMTPLRATIVDEHSASPNYRQVVKSCCARHVSSIYSTTVRVTMTAAMLKTVARGCINLEQLQIVLNSMPRAIDELLFPRSLLHLSIALNSTLVLDGRGITSVLVQICTQAPRLEKLELALHELDPRVSFETLQSLPHLVNLTIDWRGDDDLFTDEQADAIRALPNLHQVMIGRSSPAVLRRLLRRPHELRWQRLNYRWSHLDDERADLLSCLPSQTTLHVYNCKESILKAFPLPNLLNLLLSAARGGDSDASQLLPAISVVLGSSTQLTTLQLIGYHFGDGDLTLLLGQTPELRSLSITMPRRLVSLACLAAKPCLCPKLQSLSLAQCDSLDASELFHIAALPSLQKLELRDSLSGPLDATMQSRLTPPSSLIPSLTQLNYRYAS